MKLNGHELEMKYVAMATELAIAKQNPKWSDILWTGKFKRQLYIKAAAKYHYPV